MNVSRIVSSVNKWQKLDLVHPLTCGNDSNHQNLVAVDYFKKPLLICKDCDYQQEIPEMFLNEDVDALIYQYENLQNELYGK